MPPANESSKRTRSAETYTSNPPDKVKKRRLGSGQACASCRGRKSRCDGDRPDCSNCRIRGISCDYEPVTAQTEDEDELHGTNASRPVEYAENAEPARSEPLSQSNAGYVSTPPATTQRAAVDEWLRTEPPQLPAAEAARLLSSLHDKGALSEHRSNDRERHKVRERGHFADASIFDFVANICSARSEIDDQLSDQDTESHSVWDDSATSLYTSSYTNVWAPDRELPKREIADRLIDAYFSDAHALYPFIHEGSFRAEYEQMWQQTPLQLERLRVSWFGVLNAVLAHGCEFCRTISSDELQVLSTTFFVRAKRATISHISNSSTLETFQSLLLISYHVQGADFNNLWHWVGITIRLAFALNLHLNPPENVYTALQRELRKRAWWGCFILDQNLSMRIGCTPSITLKRCTVELPLQVDDQYITNNRTEPRQPINTPSMISCLVSAVNLSIVASAAVEKLYIENQSPRVGDSRVPSLSPASRQARMLSEVMLLESQLQIYWNNLPAHLKEEDVDGDFKTFKMQRLVTQIRYLGVRLLIHRQTFLSLQHKCENDFVQSITEKSSQTAIAAAKKIISLIDLHASGTLKLSPPFSVFSRRVINTADHTSPFGSSDDESRELERAGVAFLEDASHTSAAALKYYYLIKQLGGTKNLDTGGLDGTHSYNGGTMNTGNELGKDWSTGGGNGFDFTENFLTAHEYNPAEVGEHWCWDPLSFTNTSEVMFFP